MDILHGFKALVSKGVILNEEHQGSLEPLLRTRQYSVRMIGETESSPLGDCDSASPYIYMDAKGTEKLHVFLDYFYDFRECCVFRENRPRTKFGRVMCRAVGPLRSRRSPSNDSSTRVIEIPATCRHALQKGRRIGPVCCRVAAPPPCVGPTSQPDIPCPCYASRRPQSPATAY